MVQIVIPDSHHHTYGASSAYRWLICTGSVALIKKLIAEGKISGFSSNYKAELGTVIHYIIEQVLGYNVKLRYFKNAKFVPEKPESWMSEFITVDNHDLNCARIAIRHAREIMEEHPDAHFMAEQSFDMSRKYGIDFGGTCDLTFVIPSTNTVKIVDYKNGGMHVDEIRNSQLRIYGLGALQKYGYKVRIKHMDLGIIQPNGNSKKGPIRYESIKTRDLLRWDEKVLRPAIEAIKSESTSLVPGTTQCNWCPAKDHCSARNAAPSANENRSTSLRAFIPGGESKLPPVEGLTKAQLELILEQGDDIIKFITAAKAHAKKQLKADASFVDGWEYVPTESNRKLIPMRNLKRELRKAGLSYNDITVTETRELSVTEIEKKFNVRPDIAKLMKRLTYRDAGSGTLKKRSGAKADFADYLETK